MATQIRGQFWYIYPFHKIIPLPYSSYILIFHVYLHLPICHASATAFYTFLVGYAPTDIANRTENVDLERFHVGWRWIDLQIPRIWAVVFVFSLFIIGLLSHDSRCLWTPIFHSSIRSVWFRLIIYWQIHHFWLHLHIFWFAFAT